MAARPVDFFLTSSHSGLKFVGANNCANADKNGKARDFAAGKEDTTNLFGMNTYKNIRPLDLILAKKTGRGYYPVAGGHCAYFLVSSLTWMPFFGRKVMEASGVTL